jgi:HEAT repeat protein
MGIDFEQTLSGGHPNSLGNTEHVVREVQRSEDLLEPLFRTLRSDDPVVRMRAGDALEKVCREHPEWFSARFGDVRSMGAIDQPSVQWHTAQILTHLDLNPAQRQWGLRWLWRTLERTDDWIVISETLTALAGFASTSPALKPRLAAALRKHSTDRRPAVARRAAKLQDQLGLRNRS